MLKNDFVTDTAKTPKKEFLNRMSGIFTCAVFLTGICSIAGIWFLGYGVIHREWNEMGVVPFAWKTLMYLICMIAFVSLVKIAIDEKPFSRTLTWCIRIIGILLLTASVLFPRLPGYHSSGFEIFASQHFTLIDGAILLPGILFLIFSALIEEGFRMQKEIDEVL